MQSKEHGCKIMKVKCLRTKLKHKTNSLKPSKLFPHWHRLPKWEEKLEGQYNMSSSTTCAFLKIWVKSNAPIQWRIVGGNQTILRIQRLQKKTKWRIPIEIKWKTKGSKNQMKTKYFMIKSTKCSKHHEGNSPRYMHHVGFVLIYSVHNMESSLPSR